MLLTPSISKPRAMAGFGVGGAHSLSPFAVAGRGLQQSRGFRKHDGFSTRSAGTLRAGAERVCGALSFGPPLWVSPVFGVSDFLTNQSTGIWQRNAVAWRPALSRSGFCGSSTLVGDQVLEAAPQLRPG